jgi:predicted metal-dependent hydrolase
MSFNLDERTLRSFLEKATRKNISLSITDNSSTMLSLKEERNSVSVRLNRIFLSAAGEVLDEVADFIKNSRRKTPHIRRFINQNTHCLKKRPPRRVSLKTQGKHYNLLDMYQALNKEYFWGRISASITWSTKNQRRAAQKMTLGSYSSHSTIIRINPILDSKRVPRYFLEYIIYHEMLHADMGNKTDGGRCLVHPQKFRKREKLFKHYKRALIWEKKRL